MVGKLVRGGRHGQEGSRRRMSQLVKAAMTSGIAEAGGLLKARRQTQSEAVDEATGCGVVMDGMLRCRQAGGPRRDMGLGRAGTVG